MDLEKETPNISPPLPEIHEEPVSPRSPSWVSRSELPQTWVVGSEHTGFHQGPISRRQGAKLIIWSWFAAVIDALVLVGMSVIFLTLFLSIMKSSWQGFVYQGKDFLIFSGLSIFVLFCFLYMIMLRSSLGFTLGDWACDLRLGSLAQRQSSNYSLRVVLRSLFLLGTGVFVLPVLSLAFRKDLVGSLCGIRLYSLR